MGRRSGKRPESTVVASPRIRERRRAVRLERVARHKRKIVAVAVVTTLGTGGWALAHSRLFALERIEVRGNSLLGDRAVVAASGLRVGMNMLSVDTGAVESALEGLAVVDAARAERRYPSRVVITVVERAPAVQVETATGVWLADDHGRLIVPVDGTSAGMTRLRVNAPVGSSELADALRLWAALPPSVRTRIAAVDAADPGALSAVLDGIQVVFGSPEDVEAKLRAVGGVLARAKADGVRVRRIDVRAPKRPAALLA